jgi:hypothetical protein
MQSLGQLKSLEKIAYEVSALKDFVYKSFSVIYKQKSTKKKKKTTSTWFEQTK